jgi:hypothetical protein
MSEVTDDRTSRAVIALYAAVAAFNVLSFAFSGHDLNKLGIAALLVVMMDGQKTLVSWRETARAWRASAELWRKLAEERGQR